MHRRSWQRNGACFRPWSSVGGWMRQRQEVSVSQRGQSCSVFSGGSVGQSGLVLDGPRMFIWPIWPICAFRLCLWNQQAAVSSLRGALGTATTETTETIGGRYQGGRRYNLELFGSCIVFYHILSTYVTIVLLYQWLETMFERTFCGNDVWILSPPATCLDESWKGTAMTTCRIWTGGVL